MLHETEPSMPERPTHHLSEDHKAILDDMVSDMPAEHVRHVGNHLHNQADKLEDHGKKTITMDDYKRAIKGESDESQ